MHAAHLYQEISKNGYFLFIFVTEFSSIQKPYWSKFLHELYIVYMLENAMLRKELKPYLVGYVNGNYEDVDDQLVFAYNEAHAIETILQTFDDAKFVYDSQQVFH